MNITCKPMSEVAPKVHLRSVTSVSGGTDAPGTFEGADIATTNGGTATNSFLVEEDFLQELTVSNASGNTDITGYPILVRNDAYEGEDVVLLQRGDYKKRLNLNFVTNVGADIKRATGITEDATYLRYSYEWLQAMLNAGGDSAVYSGATRNADCWLAGEDLTGVPYHNTTLGSCGNGLPIASQYVVGVNHFPVAVGAEMTWRLADGTSVTRTVIGASEIGTGAGDLRVLALSSALPAGIKIYPVAGRWLIRVRLQGA